MENDISYIIKITIITLTILLSGITIDFNVNFNKLFLKKIYLYFSFSGNYAKTQFIILQILGFYDIFWFIDNLIKSNYIMLNFINAYVLLQCLYTPILL